MTEGFLPQNVAPVATGIEVRSDHNVDARNEISVRLTQNVETPSAQTDVASISGQHRKISPYEPAPQVAQSPQPFSVHGLSGSGQVVSPSFLGRLAGFFSPENGKPSTLSSSHGKTGLSPGADGNGGSPKTAGALKDFEKMQQVTVGYALLSSLTQSVLSSVKRLTQGQ